MPNYTLHYFNGRGRAEIIRMMFGVAGVKYMDKRYEFTDWDRCRNDFPCMWLPCLEMDGGMRMPETMSICRHLAREFNFYPKSNMDMFRCDYICDCFYEIMDDYMRYYHYKNGRFRYNYMENSMMGSNMSSGMGSNMSSGMGSNMSSGMGSNMSSGMGMGSNMSSGMGNMSSGMGNMSSGMGNMSSGMGNMSSGMGMGSNMSSGMGMGSNMSSGMEMGSNMSSGMGMGSNMSSGSGMGGDYEKYMYWRYMNTFNRCMPFMERTLGMRNSGSQFFMGEQMMWCDMMMYCCMENMYMENQSMFSNYPKMMGLYNRVAGHTKVSAYLKGRRSTPW